MKKQQYAGLWLSYLLVLPIGMLLLFGSLIIPGLLLGEGLYVVFSMLGIPFLFFILAYIISLGPATKACYRMLSKQETLLNAAFTYSVIINGMSWGIFSVLVLITSPTELQLLVIPFFAFILGTLFFTFTIGLFVAHQIKVKGN